MRLNTLTERIENAKAKIEKKQNTITKKEALIIKKTALIGKDDWAEAEIKWLREDISRLQREITETQASLEKYEAQMIGEMEKEKELKDIPETVKRMQTELVTKWDEWDIEYREQIKRDERELDWETYRKKYRGVDTYTLKYRTNEQIHEANMQDAKVLILNLIHRVKDITGEITDWSGITATVGTWGMIVLNGVVIGKEGRAIVESIYAGGYNIQRLHVRVLVKEV